MILENIIKSDYTQRKAFLFQTMLDELDDEMLLLDEVDTKENFSLVTITITIAINITITINIYTFNPPRHPPHHHHR